MISMTTDALLAFMRKHHYEADLQTDTQQVYTIYKIDKKEFPLFLRIFDDGHLLQVIVFIPSHLQASSQLSDKKLNPPPSTGHPQKEIVADLARLLHLLNKELDVPGLGMDEMAGVVFYRVMVPAPKKKIDEDLLVAFIKTTEHVCKMFSNPIEAVSSGQMTLDQILEKAQEMEK